MSGLTPAWSRRPKAGRGSTRIVGRTWKGSFENRIRPCTRGLGRVCGILFGGITVYQAHRLDYACVGLGNSGHRGGNHGFSSSSHVDPWWSSVGSSVVDRRTLSREAKLASQCTDPPPSLPSGSTFARNCRRRHPREMRCVRVPAQVGRNPSGRFNANARFRNDWRFPWLHGTTGPLGRRGYRCFRQRCSLALIS